MDEQTFWLAFPRVEDLGSLPDELTPEDLPNFNACLGRSLRYLLYAYALREKGEHRKATIFALEAASHFFMHFRTVIAGQLFLPLRDLLDGVRALDQNLVVSLLRPTPTTSGGGAPATMGRQTFLGFVVLATKVLRSTGMTVVEVDRFVAEHLDKIGIRPNRGSGRVTARTVRGWRETAAADVGQYTMAGIIGHMVSAEALEQRDNPGSPAEVRKRVTELLEHLGRALLSDELREKKTT